MLLRMGILGGVMVSNKRADMADMSDMDAQLIYYEQPLHELVRVSLRLAPLFNRLAFLIEQTDALSHRLAVSSLCDILALLDRPDLKSKWAKEFNRLTEVFTRLMASPGVDTVALDQCLTEVRSVADYLQQQTGKLALPLYEHYFVSQLRQYLSLPGGGAGFDFPAFHQWIHQAPADRVADLTQWRVQLSEVEAIVSLHLDLIRGSAVKKQVCAENGFFQLNLDASAPCHLVSVGVAASPLFPEISVGKHRMSIRFLETQAHTRPKQSTVDVNFELRVAYL